MECLKLHPCPFCGSSDIKMSGDHTVYCACGASVNEYDYTKNTSERVITMWNSRSLNLEPLIYHAANMTNQGSAYTDLCSANYKLNNRKVKEC